MPISIIETLDLFGLGLLSYRLFPRGSLQNSMLAKSNEFVSIIVPARNEEKALPRLLKSLGNLEYPNYEIIVVNDQSTDRTLEVAKSFDCLVIDGQPKPDGWQGKNWACHQGSLLAKGSYFLFTDADTMHEPPSLSLALNALKSENAKGLSALPFHSSQQLWARCLGPFQCILLAMTNPYGKPKKGQVFAIGQYLLFDASFYKKFGGHESIRSHAIDDLNLAHQVIDHQGRWTVWKGPHLFQVTMYESLRDFIKGWRRNFRGGFDLQSKGSPLEVTLYLMALTAVRDPSPLTAIVTLLSLILIGVAQRRFGNHTAIGVLVLPYSLAIFTLVSALALFDKIFKRPLVWKNRAYISSARPH